MSMTLSAALMVVLAASCAIEAAEFGSEANQETLLAAFHRESTNRLLLVNDQIHVQEFDVESKRIAREFERPRRKPGSLFTGFSFQDENYRIQVSPDGRLLAAVYEPEGKDGNRPEIAYVVVVWDCETGKIIRESDIPQDEGFSRYSLKFDFLLSGQHQLLYHQNSDVLRVWDIQQSKFVHRHRIKHHARVHVDQKASRVVFYDATELTLHDAATGERLLSIPLNGLIGGQPLFLEDGRILFGAYPQPTEEKPITSPYPLLVCYDTKQCRMLWSQPFDTFPCPWLVSPDGSQLAIYFQSLNEINPKIPQIDKHRTTTMMNWNERRIPTLSSSITTLNLSDGSNRVHRSQIGWFFDFIQDGKYSPSGNRIAYIRSHPSDRQNVALIKAADWSYEKWIDLEGGGWKESFFLPDEQAIVIWGTHGLVHWETNESTAQWVYPPARQNPRPARAEKPPVAVPK